MFNCMWSVGGIGCVSRPGFADIGDMRTKKQIELLNLKSQCAQHQRDLFNHVLILKETATDLQWWLLATIGSAANRSPYTKLTVVFRFWLGVATWERWRSMASCL